MVIWQYTTGGYIVAYLYERFTILMPTWWGTGGSLPLVDELGRQQLLDGFGYGGCCRWGGGGCFRGCHGKVFGIPVQHVLVSFFSLGHYLRVVLVITDRPAMKYSGKHFHKAFDLQAQLRCNKVLPSPHALSNAPISLPSSIFIYP